MTASTTLSSWAAQLAAEPADPGMEPAVLVLAPFDGGRPMLIVHPQIDTDTAEDLLLRGIALLRKEARKERLADHQ